MKKRDINRAFRRLGEQFANRKWPLVQVPGAASGEKMYPWPGRDDEEIYICIYKGKEISEPFHRHDFFFFNFAYKGSYGAFSERFDNHIMIREGEFYIGQPFSGYSLGRKSDEAVIVGVLVRKETFYRTFLPMLSVSSGLMRFFLEPQANQFSDEFIHLKFADDSAVRALLEMMAVEYDAAAPDAQDILKPLALSLFMFVARQYEADHPPPHGDGIADKIVQYMSAQNNPSLKVIAHHFGYNPNYLSALLHKKLGKSFSQIVLERRMEYARLLLRGADLPIEEIADMLGYANTSNFYKAFRAYYGTSPRKAVQSNRARAKEA